MDYLPRSLKRLSLAQIGNSDLVIKQLTYACPDLTHLCLNGCPITDFSLKMLGTNTNNKLKRLVRTLPGPGGNPPGRPHQPAASSRRWDRLQWYSPQHLIQILENCFKITDVGLSFLTVGCPHLRFAHCWLMVMVVLSCQHMRAVSLSECSQWQVPQRSRDEAG